jgi:molybdopterin molybdotransferase
MQPGKPQGFGRTPTGTLLLGLPGNPVSAAVSFELFVRPALRALEGDADLGRETLRVALAAGRRARPERVQYVPVHLDASDPERWTAVPTAHGTRGLGDADGLAIIPPSDQDLAAGDLVTVTRW